METLPPVGAAVGGVAGLALADPESAIVWALAGLFAGKAALALARSL